MVHILLRTFPFEIWESAWPLLKQITATYYFWSAKIHVTREQKETYIDQKLETLQHRTHMASGPPEDALSDICVCFQWMTSRVEPNKKSPQDKAGIERYNSH